MSWEIWGPHHKQKFNNWCKIKFSVLSKNLLQKFIKSFQWYWFCLILLSVWVDNKQKEFHPFDETHLVVVRGLIHQEVSPEYVNKESSTERCSYNRQANRSPQL